MCELNISSTKHERPDGPALDRKGKRHVMPASKTGYLTCNEFADAIGVHPNTVRKWDSNGFLKPYIRMPGGKRFYSRDQIDDYFRRLRSDAQSQGPSGS